MAGHRIDRISEDISRELTAILRTVKDPRVSGTLLTIDDLAYVSREGMEAVFAMLRSMNEVGTVKLVMPQDMPIRYLVADAYHVDEENICGGMVRMERAS